MVVWVFWWCSSSLEVVEQLLFHSLVPVASFQERVFALLWKWLVSRLHSLHAYIWYLFFYLCNVTCLLCLLLF